MYNQYNLLLVLALLVANLRFVASLFLFFYVLIFFYDEFWASEYMYRHKAEWIK
jgi:hypothetical protein